MSNVPVYIRNHEAVTAAFGYWPSFHDAHVLDFSCSGPASPGVVTLVLHGFEMARKTDARGFFELIKHHRVAFRFTLLEGDDFQPPVGGNILLDLEFSTEEEFHRRKFFTVQLTSAIEPSLCAEFRVQAGEVVSVVPCSTSGDIYPA